MMRMAMSKSKKRMLRFLFFIIVLNSLFYVFFILKKKDFTREPVLLAYVGPVSQAYGRDIANAIEMYMEKINQAGGIHGRKVKLRRFDDQNDPQKAARIAHEIARKKEVLLVLGHSTSDASLAAADVYDVNGVPAITADATSEAVTDGHPWYFRVIPNNVMQADFVANYLYFTLGCPSASLVFAENEYGASLANAFEATAMKIGLQLRGKWGFPVTASKADGRLNAIIEEISALDDPGAILLAMEMEPGIRIISALKESDKNYLIVGTDAFSENGFISQISRLAREQSPPGAYSDGVLCTAPFMTNIAVESVYEFSREYLNRFGKNPSWSVGCYYDAVHVALEAIKQAPVELSGQMGLDRKKVRQALARFYDENNAVEGITGLLYFDAEGNVNRPYAMGVYQKQRLLPAFTQYQPITLPRDGDTLFQRVLAGEYTLVDKKLMDKFRVIYTDIALKQISQIDARRGICTLDFDCWFRFPEGLDPGVIEFTNSVNSMRLGDPAVEQTENGLTTRVYSVTADFKLDLNDNHYPYDSLVIPIYLRHASKTADRLIHVARLSDFLGDKKVPEKDPGDRIALPRGWKIAEISLSQDELFKDTRIAHSGVLGDKQMTQLAQFAAHIRLQKTRWGQPGTRLCFLIFICAAVYAIYFIPPVQLLRRILVWVLALSVALIGHLKIMSLSPPFYAPPGEYGVLGLYLIGLTFIYLSIKLHDYHRRGDENTCARLMRASKIVFPCLVLMVIILLLTPSIY